MAACCQQTLWTCIRGLKASTGLGLHACRQRLSQPWCHMDSTMPVSAHQTPYCAAMPAVVSDKPQTCTHLQHGLAASLVCAAVESGNLSVKVGRNNITVPVFGSASTQSLNTTAASSRYAQHVGARSQLGALGHPVLAMAAQKQGWGSSLVYAQALLLVGDGTMCRQWQPFCTSRQAAGGHAPPDWCCLVPLAVSMASCGPGAAPLSCRHQHDKLVPAPRQLRCCCCCVASRPCC